MEQLGDTACLERVHTHTIDVIENQSKSVLPNLAILSDARSTLLRELPDEGLGTETATEHLLKSIAPALNGASLSPNYYGFVTGGITPAARIAEGLVSLYDQSPQVHLPNQTVATNVEDKALRLLMELFYFDPSAWSGVFTTGATASNVLGLACGREHIINERLKSRLGGDSNETLGSLGLLRACSLAGMKDIHIYTTMAHSSLYKASSILGLGRSCIKDLRSSESGLNFDFDLLEEKLASGENNSASIVAISCAEVNTGLFATSGIQDLRRLRQLCDRYRAWIHVDGGKALRNCLSLATDDY